jgi:hypothetical protein
LCITATLTIDVRVGSNRVLGTSSQYVRFAPCQRKSNGPADTSQSCQQRTHAVQQTASLFNYLVGANQNRWRDRKTERLGGLDVDGHREFYRQLDRQVRHLDAAQNAIDIAGGASKLIGVVRSIELVPHHKWTIFLDDCARFIRSRFALKAAAMGWNAEAPRRRRHRRARRRPSARARAPSA